MTWLVRLFTSFDGRISRMHWWIGSTILCTVGIGVSILINPSAITLNAAPELQPTLWQSLWSIAVTVPTLAIMFKRLNDRDHPRAIGYAWACVAIALIVAQQLGFPRDLRDIATLEWVVLAPAGLFGLWILIDNGFLKGTPGPNRYGPDPLAPKPGAAAPGSAPPTGTARAGRSTGAVARDATVGVLGLIVALYLVLPGLSLEGTVHWLARAAVSRSIDPLEGEMRANAQGWQAFQAGQAAADQKRDSEAVSHYDRAIETYANKSKPAGRVLMWRGHSLRDLGRLRDALRDYSAAIAIDPDASAMRYSSRAYVYAELKRYEDALKDHDQAIRLWPEHARHHLRRGDALRNLGRLGEALEAYEICIAAARKDYDQMARTRHYINYFKTDGGRKFQKFALERRDKVIASAHESRGIALRDLGRVDDAIAAFDEAVQLRPTYVSAYRNRGWLYTQQGRLDLARADYERGLKISNSDEWLRQALRRLSSPDASVNALINLANGLRDRRRYRRALDTYNEALQKKPDHALALLNRGWLYHLQNQLEAALSDYGKAVELDPGEADAYVYRGRAYEQLNKFDKASADFEQAVRLKPDHWRVYFWRGWLHHRQKRLDLAVVDYTRSIELRPGFDDVYLFRGHAYRDLGQSLSALADYDKALELSPEYVTVYRNRGWLHFKQSRFDLARADYERGLELAPNDKWLQQALARLNKKTGK